MSLPGTALLVAALLAPTAPADDDVVVSGRFVLADGSPAASRPVVVSRATTVSDTVDDVIGSWASLNLAVLSCATSDPSLDLCRNNKYATTTRADGRFRIRLSGRDVRNKYGDLRGLQITTGLRARPGQATGPTVVVRTEPSASDVALPTVPVWSAGPSARLTGTIATYRWRPAPIPAGATEARTTLGLNDQQRGLQATADDPESPLRIDTRDFEGAAPTLGLTASARVGGRLVAWTSETVRTKPSAVRPLSRGRGCLVGLGDQQPVRRQSCWLFDGRLAAPLADVHPDGKGPTLGRPRPVWCGRERDTWGNASCVRAPVASVTVDLGRTRPVGRIAVRASGNATWLYAVAETSLDRRTWRLAGRFTENQSGSEQNGLRMVRGAALVEAPAGTTARYVRIRADDPPGPQDEFTVTPGNVRQDRRAKVRVFRGDLAAMTEVSVWPAVPRPVAPTPTPTPGRTAPVADSGDGEGDGEGDGGSGAGGWVLAAIAGIVLLAGFGVLVRTRPW
jgi:hypothetical protein